MRPEFRSPPPMKRVRHGAMCLGSQLGRGDRIAEIQRPVTPANQWETRSQKPRWRAWKRALDIDLWCLYAHVHMCLHIYIHIWAEQSRNWDIVMNKPCLQAISASWLTLIYDDSMKTFGFCSVLGPPHLTLATIAALVDSLEAIQLFSDRNANSAHFLNGDTCDLFLNMNTHQEMKQDYLCCAEENSTSEKTLFLDKTIS